MLQVCNRLDSFHACGCHRVFQTAQSVNNTNSNNPLWLFSFQVSSFVMNLPFGIFLTVCSMH